MEKYSLLISIPAPSTSYIAPSFFTWADIMVSYMSSVVCFFLFFAYISVYVCVSIYNLILTPSPFVHILLVFFFFT